jgi:hypothetical protein
MKDDIGCCFMRKETALQEYFLMVTEASTHGSTDFQVQLA